MTVKSYPIYKGLQKPLTYKGFKGKYIYWGLASLLLGLVMGSIAAAISNMILAALIALTSMASGLGYTIIKQKKGQYSKVNHSGKFIHQTQLSIHYVKRK